MTNLKMGNHTTVILSWKQRKFFGNLSHGIRSQYQPVSTVTRAGQLGFLIPKFVWIIDLTIASRTAMGLIQPPILRLQVTATGQSGWVVKPSTHFQTLNYAG